MPSDGWSVTLFRDQGGGLDEVLTPNYSFDNQLFIPNPLAALHISIHDSTLKQWCEKSIELVLSNRIDSPFNKHDFASGPPLQRYAASQGRRDLEVDKSTPATL